MKNDYKSTFQRASGALILFLAVWLLLAFFQTWPLTQGILAWSAGGLVLSAVLYGLCIRKLKTGSPDFSKKSVLWSVLIQAGIVIYGVLAFGLTQDVFCLIWCMCLFLVVAISAACLCYSGKNKEEEPLIKSEDDKTAKNS